MNCNLCYPEDLESLDYEQPTLFPSFAANGYEKNMRNSRNSHHPHENQNFKSQKISLKPKKQISGPLFQRKQSVGFINSINSHFNSQYQPSKHIHLLPTHNHFYQQPPLQPIPQTYTSQPKKIYTAIHNYPISPKRAFFADNRIPIQKSIPLQRIVIPEKRAVPKTLTQINAQPKQQVINSYCQNQTTVPSQWHYVEQNLEEETSKQKQSNASVYRLTINNQCIGNSKRNESNFRDSSLEEESSNGNKERKEVIHSSCQIRDIGEQQLEIPENKKNLAQSHRQMREVRHASMDFLQCKRAQSLDSESSSQMSEVIMSHQDFLSRNIVNEQIEESQYEEFQDQEGIKHNIFVGKTELLPRQSHF